MYEVDCVKIRNIHPTAFMYNIVINACGKVGYTKKAFELFKKVHDEVV